MFWKITVRVTFLCGVLITLKLPSSIPSQLQPTEQTSLRTCIKACLPIRCFCLFHCTSILRFSCSICFRLSSNRILQRKQIIQLVFFLDTQSDNPTHALIANKFQEQEYQELKLFFFFLFVCFCARKRT